MEHSLVWTVSKLRFSKSNVFIRISFCFKLIDLNNVANETFHDKTSVF